MFINDNRIIFNYIKNSKKNKIGIFAAVYNRESKEVGLGWSLCSKKDIFDRDIGLDLAYDRTFDNDQFRNNDEIIPKSIKKHLPKFLIRIKKYFKNEKFSEFVNDLMNEMK